MGAGRCHRGYDGCDGDLCVRPGALAPGRRNSRRVLPKTSDRRRERRSLELANENAHSQFTIMPLRSAHPAVLIGLVAAAAGLQLPTAPAPRPMVARAPLTTMNVAPALLRPITAPVTRLGVVSLRRTGLVVKSAGFKATGVLTAAAAIWRPTSVAFTAAILLGVSWGAALSAVQRRVVANDGALEALEADCAAAGWQEEHCEALDAVAPDGAAKVTLSAWEKLRAFDRLPLSAFRPQLS